MISAVGSDPARWAESEAVFVAALTAFRDVPGFLVLDEVDLLRTVAIDRPYVFLNGVVRLALTTDEPIERIRAVRADYAARGLPASWWLTPGARPADLATHLRAAGLVRAEQDRGMVIDLDPWPDTMAASETLVTQRLEIVEVTSGHDLERWIVAMAQSYGWDDRRRAAHLAELYDPVTAPLHERRQLLALVDGRPVACASLFEVETYAWVTNVGTVPAARGQGIGGAVTARCLELAAERGHRRAWLAASPAGVPVYRRLGFVDTGPLVGYRAPHDG